MFSWANESFVSSVHVAFEALPDPPAVAKEIPWTSIAGVSADVGLNGLGESLHKKSDFCAGSVAFL